MCGLIILNICSRPGVVHLVNYQHSTYLHPTREGWLDKMVNLVERIYCH